MESRSEITTGDLVRFFPKSSTPDQPVPDCVLLHEFDPQKKHGNIFNDDQTAIVLELKEVGRFHPTLWVKIITDNGGTGWIISNDLEVLI